MTDSPSDNVAPPPLDRCPVCRYSLQGLPSAYRCPECGLEYDEQTRVWRPTSFRTFAGLTLQFTFIFLANLIFHSLLGTGKAPILQQAIGFSIVATCLVFFIIRYRAHPFVAVGPSGISYKLGFKAPITVPWQDVIKVDWGLTSSFTDVRLRFKGSTSGVDLSRIVRGDGQARDFDKCVEERKAAFLNLPNKT